MKPREVMVEQLGHDSKHAGDHGSMAELQHDGNNQWGDRYQHTHLTSTNTPKGLIRCTQPIYSCDHDRGGLAKQSTSVQLCSIHTGLVEVKRAVVLASGSHHDFETLVGWARDAAEQGCQH